MQHSVDQLSQLLSPQDKLTRIRRYRTIHRELRQTIFLSIIWNIIRGYSRQRARNERRSAFTTALGCRPRNVSGTIRRMDEQTSAAKFYDFAVHVHEATS